MRAVFVHRPEGSTGLVVRDIEEPRPMADQVLVDVAYAGVNFADVLMCSAGSSTPSPFVPGVEGAGVVAAIGDDVVGYAPGDRVAWAPVGQASAIGSYAARAAVSAAQLLRVPDDVPLRVAAAMTLQGLTAQYLVCDIRQLRPGSTVLVHAAAGGTGRLVVQWARHHGATVFGTVSTDAKASVAIDAGAHHVIRYDREDVVAAIAALTAERGVDYIVDGVGGAIIHTDLACVAQRGTIAVFGRAAGPPELISPLALIPKSVSLVGGYMTNFLRNPAEVDASAAFLWRGVRDGWLTPLIETLPLHAAAEAHTRLAGRATVGKLILEINGALA